ncbi:hypothetical protein GC194_06855 [bacterium]|nr:hypothetical protein [bacterium]
MNFNKRRHLGLLCISFLFSCQQLKEFKWRKQVRNSPVSLAVDYDLVEAMLANTDSVIRLEDTIIQYCSSFDTVLLESGIFSYLNVGYQIHGCVPDSVMYGVRNGESFELLGEIEKACRYHLLVYKYYKRHWTPSTKGYLWTDGNSIFQYRVNTSILISYSLEQLGMLDDAIKTLKPWMSNKETYGIKIHRRFVELCIKKYGLDSVRQQYIMAEKQFNELSETNSLYDEVILSVFGAQIGLGDTWINHPIDSIDVIDVLKRDYVYDLLQL